MCGIFGFAKREGWQSPSDELVCGKDWHGILEKIDANTTVFMGHVRLATKGMITEQNAHPFVKGSVIGAHNGIIDNYDKIASKIGKSIQVDSEVIFGLLNKKEKYQEVFDLIEGDFALSWVDEDYRVLKLMHEEGRPLHVAYWKKARCLFWASTAKILGESLREAGLVIDIKELPVDEVYEFNTQEFWGTPNENTVKVKTNENYVRYSYTGGYGDGYGFGGNLYSRVSDSCKVCGDNTYRKDGMCYRCAAKPKAQLRLDKDGEWTVNCVECREEFKYDEVEDTYNGYLCDTCGYNTSFNISGSSYGGNRHDIKSCDYCGDYQPTKEMVVVNSYTLCAYCESTEKKYGGAIQISGGNL